MASKHINSVNFRFEILKGKCFPFRVPCTYVAPLLINGISIRQEKNVQKQFVDIISLYFNIWIDPSSNSELVIMIENTTIT